MLSIVVPATFVIVMMLDGHMSFALDDELLDEDVFIKPVYPDLCI